MVALPFQYYRAKMCVPDAALQGLNGAVQEMGFALKKIALGILAALAFPVAADCDLFDGKARDAYRMVPREQRTLP